MTLTEVSFYSRKYMPVVILVGLLFLIFFYLIKLMIMLNPPAPQSARIMINPIFDKISVPIINDLASPSAQINYVFDTIEGTPITATDTAKIFQFQTGQVSFGYLNKIYLTAKSLGFDTEIVKHTKTDNMAEFDSGKQRLSIDIQNYNFTYEYRFTDEPDLFNNVRPPEKEESEQKAKDFLILVDRYPQELTQGKTNTVFFSYSPQDQTMTRIDDSSQANMVEVDFFRPDIDNFPTVSPLNLNSQNYVIMMFTNDGFKILRAQVKFYETDQNKIGIYPLIIVGMIPALLSTNGSSFAIRAMPTGIGFAYILALGFLFGWDIFKKLKYKKLIIPIITIALIINFSYVGYIYFFRRPVTVGEIFNEHERSLSKYVLDNKNQSYPIYHRMPQDGFLTLAFFDKELSLPMVQKQMIDKTYADNGFIFKVCNSKLNYQKQTQAIISEGCLDVKTYDFFANINNPKVSYRIPYKDYSLKTAYFITR